MEKDANHILNLGKMEAVGTDRNLLKTYFQRIQSIWNRSDDERADVINLLNKTFDFKGEYLLQDVRPCFFSGNIMDRGEKGKIYLLTANPHYSSKDTPIEFERFAKKIGLWDFDTWKRYCLNRFHHYKTEGQVHPIFQEAVKIITGLKRIGDVRKKYGDTRKVLQTRIVNLDWCPYYSTKFSSSHFNLSVLNDSNPDHRRVKDEIVLWNDLLQEAITNSKPAFVLVFGKNYDIWLKDQVHFNREPLAVSQNKSVKIISGKFRNDITPVIYTNTALSGSNISYIDFIRTQLPSILKTHSFLS